MSDRPNPPRQRRTQPEKVNGRPKNLTDAPMFADPTMWASTNKPSSHPSTPSTTQTRSAPAGRPRGWVDQDAAVDWALVRRLKRQTVDKVEDLAKQYRQRHDREPSPDDLREFGKPIISSVVADHARGAAAGGELWPSLVEDRYFKAVFDSQFGYGRLQPLFEIPTATDVTVHGCDSIRVLHNDGRRERLPPIADSDEELMEQLRQMASNARPRRAFDATNLDMTLMIDERFRVHAISNEIGVRPRVAIRQHHLIKVSLADLAVRGMMPDYVASLLDAAVRANFTIAVVGEQGVGKALALDTPIPTPKGWVAMGDLQRGDQVFDEQGQPCRVEAAHPVQLNRPCYEVTFDDGTSITADADHLWRVSRRTDRLRAAAQPSTPSYWVGDDERRRLDELAAVAAFEWDRTVTVAELVGEVGEKHRTLLGQEAKKLGPLGHTRKTWSGYRGACMSRDIHTYSRHSLLEALAARRNQPIGAQRRITTQSVVLTTAELAASSVWAHEDSPWRTRNHAIDLAQPLQYSTKQQHINPYVLGIWLGDGTTTAARVTTADADVLHELEAAGYPVRRTGSRPYDYAVGGSLHTQLRLAGVLGDKHVPRAYLQGDQDQRLALLQGLMDSDGTCNRAGSCQFTSTLEVLAEQVLELVRGLGYKPSFTVRPVTFKGRPCGLSYIVHWTTRDPMFRLSRKLERQSLNKGGPTRRYITSVCPVESVPVRCITVNAPSSLFLAGAACVPTHNTTVLRSLIDAVPLTEAFGTLETDLELFAHLMPGRDNDMALFARSGMGERDQAGGLAGAVGISEMVDMALRQSLQRLIIGELRGSEASAVFQAMQIGAGTMFTTHSRDAQTAPIRLASRVSEGRVYTVEEAMRQIGLLVDLIVYVEMIDDAERGGGLRRQVSNIVACSPGDDARPAFGEVYTTDLDGHPLKFTPPEKMLAKLDRHRRATLHRYEEGR